MGDVKHQWGVGEQVDWDTPITPNRFFEFVSETHQHERNIAVSQGIRSGRKYGGQGRRETRRWATGTLNTEVATSGFGLFFKHLLGDVATVEDEVGDAWTHTFTPDSAALVDTGLTLQKGVMRSDRTVEPFTYPGSKIVSAGFSIDEDGLLMCSFEFLSREEETTTALASASYATPKIFTYAQGALKVDSTTMANVRSVGSLQIGNNYIQRWFLGNQGLMSEPTNVPFDTLAGNLDVEFQNNSDFYDLFVADTSAELELEFVGDIIAGTTSETLRITVADTRFEGETPKIGGPELIYQGVPFVGLDPASGAAVTIEYTTDTATP
jgi:hypothetical protein